MLKKIICGICAVCVCATATGCSYLPFGQASSVPAQGSSEAEVVSSEAPSSSEIMRGAMDNNEAIDYCLRLYNLIHPIASMKSADGISDEDYAELKKIIKEMKQYGDDDDQRTIYAVCMATAAEIAVNYAADGSDSTALDKAVEAAKSAYYDMYMGFRQELRYLPESEWKKAAVILSAK